MQILDSYGVDKLANNEAGAIYQKKAADLNASTAPETWQSTTSLSTPSTTS
ncbi:hypothetical protein [Streptomyces sp. NPDC005507]|uniref:hypothetical protein n=1 Tax=Streptomyces sp. NPDC005507 TaxID=3154885 RepID=UPI0033B7E754